MQENPMKPKTYSANTSDGRTVKVTVPEDPKPEELLDDALRDNLSPEAIAVIVAYLQPARSKDAAADRQVRWFSDRLVALLGADQFRRMQDELGL
jgi:hypothetical protein